MQHTHRHPRRLWSILLTFVALLGAGGMAQAQVVYTYDAAPVISIPEDGGQANCRAPSGLTRSVDIPFTVTDTFTVGDGTLPPIGDQVGNRIDGRSGEWDMDRSCLRLR